MKQKLLRSFWVVGLIVFIALSFRQCAKAEAWEPATWHLDPMQVSGAVGDTIEVAVIFEIPSISIVRFYRIGIQHGPGLAVIEFIRGPDTVCLGFLTINYDGYEDWDLIVLDGGATQCNWRHWDGWVATIRFVVVTEGPSLIRIFEAANTGTSMNHIFPTDEYYARTAEEPCPVAPWAYATNPADFNGTNSNHPCVAPLLLGEPITINAEPVSVLEWSHSWGAVKGLYR